MEASKQEPGKQLKEYLQHNQDPFSLHDYISERSYMFNSLNKSHYFHSANKNLKLWILRKRLFQAKGILRSVLDKFNVVLAGSDETSETRNYGVSLTKRSSAASDDEDVHFSDYINDVGDMFLSYEHQGSTVKDMFQTFTLPKLRRLERSKEYPMLSTYLRKILMTSDIVKKRPETVKTNPLWRIKEKIMHKRKQILLYDCVEKAREFHENEGQTFSITEVSELEGIESIIQERFLLLEKQYGEAKRTIQMLHSESFITSQEWINNSEKVKGELQMEIGDAIMDDILTEMIDLFSE